MVQTPEQVHPLYGKEAAGGTRRRLSRKCCSCAAALILLSAAVIIILICTVFKTPIIRVNSLDYNLNKPDILNHPNVTLNAVVSVYNPNYFASFTYGNTTSTLFYRGQEIGEARGPPGRSSARRTTQMGVAVEIMTGRILSEPHFAEDMDSGLVTIRSSTRISGRVKVFAVDKHVIVRMNCRATINVTSCKVQQHKCRRRIKL